MGNKEKIELKNLSMVKNYLRELLIDNFIGISIDEEFICQIPKFTNVKIIIR